MRKLFMIFPVIAFALSGGGDVRGQESRPSAAVPRSADAAPTSSGVIGEVSAVDLASKQMTVKTKAGVAVMVVLDENTMYLRVPPGEKTLDKVAKIMPGDVSVGDRVFARGKVLEGGKSVSARAVIVMKQADIMQKHEHDRAEWRKRGVAGVVTAVNPESKEITLLVRSREGTRTTTILAPAGVRFRRYAPDSVRFSDARPAALTELKVGDQLRALGEKSADGARFIPEEIVSGSFRTIGGEVTAISLEGNELRINDVESRKQLTVVISKDSMLRRVTPEVAEMFAQGGKGKDSQHKGGTDPYEALEDLPPVTTAELKQGDKVLISGTTGREPSRVTAIMLVAGADAFLDSLKGSRRSGSKLEAMEFGIIGLP